MTGDVDHVVDAAENAVIAIRRLHGAIATHEGPVPPVLALGIPVVPRVIRLDVAVGVAPQRLHHARPRMADADVAGRAGTCADFFAVLVVDDRMNPRRAGAAAAWLHRVNRRNRAAEKAARLGHPPRIGDDGFPLADLVVVPAPRLRLDRLADRRHRLEMVIVLARFFGTEFPQHANGRRRGVENAHAQPLGDAPGPPRIGKGRHAFVQHARRRVREGPIDNVGMSRDPADVRHTPIGVFRMNVENPLGRGGDVGQITGVAVLRTLGPARRAAGVHQEQRPLGR